MNNTCNKVIISYSGVHQAFQIALAAHEAELLDVFYVSIFDAPGKWGKLLGLLLGKEALTNRRCNGLPANRTIEYPWPEIYSRLKKICGLAGYNEWIQTAMRFDGHVANLLANKMGGILVGVENCAAESFHVGKERGMKLVYDCPGFNPEVSYQLACQAAAEWKLPPLLPPDSPVVKDRKEKELELADQILVYSDVHQKSWEKRGVAKVKFVTIPLWIDQSMWFPKTTSRIINGPLRVLFVGRGTLMKGFPYLLEAIKKCGSSVRLVLLGQVQKELRLLSAKLDNAEIYAPVSKPQLIRYYWDSDVLVLPSLGDSFGFVALEAMACGLPVIVTDNCGVPVPDPAWRVPIMNSDRIAQRLVYYSRNREALKHDGEIAAEFARRFTPERYREQIKNLLCKLLK